MQPSMSYIPSLSGGGFLIAAAVKSIELLMPKQGTSAA
jgi:hypothetical protein